MDDRELYKRNLETRELASKAQVQNWMPLSQEGPGEKAESGGRRIWGILWPNKWFLFWCAAVCAVVALGASYLQTPLYKAQTSLEIEDLNEHFLQLNEVDPVSKGGNSDSYLETQIEMLSSTTLLSRVVKRLHLEDAYQPDPNPSFLTKLKDKLNLPKLPPPSPTESAVADVRKNLDVAQPRGSSRVVTVEFISTDPQLAAKFPNTLAQEFINQGIELRIQSAHRLGTWLTKELEQSRKSLQDSENALQQYGQSAGLLFTDDKNSVAETRLKQLQEELSKAQADRMFKQSTYELVSKASPDALGQMVGNKSFDDYQIKLTDLRRQLAEAQALMKPTHYKVKQLVAQVAALESAMAHQHKETANRLGDEYSAARRREHLLQEAYDQQSQLVSAQDAKASKYNVLKNEVETNRQLYDSMLQRVKGVSVASAMHATNVVVFDPAQVPGRPFEPKPMMNSLIGWISGLLLGAIFLFLRDRWDLTLRVPGQVGLYLNVPELGAVPSAEKKLLPPSPKIQPRITPGQPVFREQNGVEYTMIRDHFATEFSDLEGASQLADSFRAILASILLSTDDGRSPSVIVLTSPSAQEGKTTTATNLAVALASIGKKVLLIDADLRKPRLHQIFGLRNHHGFSDVLADETQLIRKQISEYIQPSTINGLSVLTSGRKRIVAGNLLYGPRVSDLFARLRPEFDAVLIDTPPLLAVADARLLSRSADGVVLVCRAGTTNRERAKIAVDRLLADGTHVIGTILNDFDPRTANYAGEYEHGYSAVQNDGPELR